MRTLGVLLVVMLKVHNLLAQISVPKSVEQARAEYLGRNVYVEDYIAGCGGRVARVLDLKSLSSRSTAINALGESVADEKPKVRVSLLCSGQRVVSNDTPLGAIPFDFHLLPQGVGVQQLPDAMEEELQDFVQHAAYARDNTVFYSVDSTRSDLELARANKQTLGPSTEEPLTVEAVKVWTSGYKFFALMKLSTSLGRMFFVVTKVKPGEPLADQMRAVVSLGKPSCATLQMAHPHGQEYGSIQKGDSVEALKCQLGRPDSINSDSDGLDQWVYKYEDGRTILIYVGSLKVVAVQRIDP